MTKSFVVLLALSSLSAPCFAQKPDEAVSNDLKPFKDAKSKPVALSIKPTASNWMNYKMSIDLQTSKIPGSSKEEEGIRSAFIYALEGKLMESLRLAGQREKTLAPILAYKANLSELDPEFGKKTMGSETEAIGLLQNARIIEQNDKIIALLTAIAAKK